MSGHDHTGWLRDLHTAQLADLGAHRARHEARRIPEVTEPPAPPVEPRPPSSGWSLDGAPRATVRRLAGALDVVQHGRSLDQLRADVTRALAGGQ